MKNLLFLSTVALLITLLNSCRKDNLADDMLGIRYFPLAIGSEWIYQVDSIVYGPSINGVKKDTQRSQLREVLRDTFTDMTGEVNYILDRYRRKSIDQEWQLETVWHTLIATNKAIRVENNLRFIKLTFPIFEGSQWDGNVHFDRRMKVSIAGESIEVYKGWSYFYQQTDQQVAINNRTYEPVVQVVQVDDQETNFVERRYSIEYYAQDVGLIYREMEILDSQEINDSRPWEEKAEKGFIMQQTLISYSR